MTKIEISFILTLKFISLILDIPNMEKEALILRKKKNDILVYLLMSR